MRERLIYIYIERERHIHIYTYTHTHVPRSDRADDPCFHSGNFKRVEHIPVVVIIICTKGRELI